MPRSPVTLCNRVLPGDICAPIIETMAKLNILEYPDPRLRTRAKPVAAVDDALRRQFDYMFETMYAAPGVGLDATQVAVPLPLIVIEDRQRVGEGKRVSVRLSISGR